MMKKFSALMVILVLSMVACTMAMAEDIIDFGDYVVEVTQENAEQVSPEAELLQEVVAVAEASADLVSETVEMKEEAETRMYTVRFFDFLGNEIVVETVAEGALVAIPEETPVMSGMTFTHWADETNELREAFDFEMGISSDVNLIPCGEAEVMTGASILGDVVEFEVVEVDASGILNVAAVETVTVDMLASKILGGTIEIETEAAFNPESILAMEEIVNVEETAGDDSITSDDIITIEEDEVPLAGPAPSVEVICEYDGKLVPGTEVTVRAVVHNLPANCNLDFQWQNDANGAFQDVADATGDTYTFVVDEYSENGCNWRVNVAIAA